MKLLSKDVINDVALTTGIAPSYIEKDWYLVQILQIFANLSTNNVKAVFAGGTCLSKAYGLTKRFSEDVDFNITGLTQLSRKARSDYKNTLINALNDIEGLTIEADSIHSRDENRFCNFYIEYPKQFKLETSLRNNLKIELSFKETFLPTKTCIIESFVGQYLKDSPTAQINCISCIETAANKFNALLWRTDIKDRTQPFNHMTNDPALMRHLYDLNILFSDLIKSEEFSRLVKEIYKTDCIRGNKERNLNLEDFCIQTLSKLENDKMYAKEYEMFVSKMVYKEQANISFANALDSFRNLVHFVIESN